MIKTIKKAYNLIRFKARDIKNRKKRSSKWNKIQKEFLEKNSSCAFCDGTKNLNVHHKKPFHLYPELELEESNLITLCMGEKDCHLLIAHGNNFSYYCDNLDSYILQYKSGAKTFKEICVIAKKERIKH